VLSTLENIPRDSLIPCLDFSPVEVVFPSRENWLDEDSRHQFLNDSEVWYSDGSVMEGKAGAGVFCEDPECSISLSLGDTTIFQAEILGIELALREAAKNSQSTKNVIICSDSQAALKAIASFSVSSRAVQNCKLAYSNLRRRVTLAWVPGHEGIEGNEKADSLAREGSSIQPSGPEPFLPVTKSFVKKQYTDKTKVAFQNAWNEAECRMSKVLIVEPNLSNSRYLLSLRRGSLRALVAFLTGHGKFKSHLRRIGQIPDAMCVCGLDEESAQHLLCDCPRHWAKRKEILGNTFVTPSDCRHLKFVNVCKFLLTLKFNCYFKGLVKGSFRPNHLFWTPHVTFTLN
jgi:ribonuclease HI